MSRAGAKDAKAENEKQFLIFASFVSSRDTIGFETLSFGAGGWVFAAAAWRAERSAALDVAREIVRDALNPAVLAGVWVTLDKSGSCRAPPGAGKMRSAP